MRLRGWIGAALMPCLVAGCSWDWDGLAAAVTVDAGSDVQDVVAVDVVDVTAPVDVAMDAPQDAAAMDGGCSSDPSCAATPGTPVCDVASGRCVACTPLRDVCGAGAYCTASNTCASGCVTDDGCAASVDAGAPDAGAAGRHCDVATHACVACNTDDHCAIGNRCVAHTCVPGCDATRGCAAGRLCCAGACLDPFTDPAHCGGCNTTCSTPNGAPACAAGRCTVGRCDASFADCDGVASNGCETDTRIAAANCGACGTVCPARANATATCAAGGCGFTCLAGFADCDGVAGNGCEADLSRTLDHCGICANACSFPGGAGSCSGGVCTRSTCAPGRADCDGVAANGCETDLQADVMNCRTCGAVCRVADGVAACTAGACAVARCNAGFADCNGDPADGCEVTLASNTSNCGSCGRACGFAHASPSCVAGACVLAACNAGSGNCDGNEANGCETDLTASITNCGRCGAPCPSRTNASATCASSACSFVCASGFADCDGSSANGCEVNLGSSLANCGGCGSVCAPANAIGACRSGGCAVASCLAGFADCDGDPSNGCESDVASSTTNCGACGRSCAPPNANGTCSSGVCTVGSCTGNFLDCDRTAANGCEADPVTANANCGACGVVCAAGRSCVAGRCAVATFLGYTVSTPSTTTVPWVEACTAAGAIQILQTIDDGLSSGVLPFPIEFWGATNRSYLVSSNGWMGYGDFYGNASAIPNVMPLGSFGTLPSATAPYPAAFVLGVDLVQGASGVCVATVGTAPARQFVMESNGSQLYVSTVGRPSSQVSYELIAYENSGVLDMAFNTPFRGPGVTLNAPTNVTVGLQDFRVPQRAAVYSGNVTATTRIRFTPM